MNKPCEKCGGDHAVWNCFFKPKEESLDVPLVSVTKYMQTNPYVITRRDYFAGLAMQSIIEKLEIESDSDIVAELACQYADALIKELDKK